MTKLTIEPAGDTFLEAGKVERFCAELAEISDSLERATRLALTERRLAPTALSTVSAVCPVAPPVAST